MAMVIVVVRFFPLSSSLAYWRLARSRRASCEGVSKSLELGDAEKRKHVANAVVLKFCSGRFSDCGEDAGLRGK